MCYHEIRRYLYNCLLPLPRGTATRRGATPSSSLRDHGRKISGRRFFSVWDSLIAGVKRARARSRSDRAMRYGNNVSGDERLLRSRSLTLEPLELFGSSSLRFLNVS